MHFNSSRLTNLNANADDSISIQRKSNFSATQGIAMISWRRQARTDSAVTSAPIET